jgi:hypothetical protein
MGGRKHINAVGHSPEGPLPLLVHDPSSLSGVSRHRQMASLAAVRHMLSIWHTVHIPIGLTLFLAAFVHIVAAIYFATLLY